ncbi:MAG: hypothetical protein J1F31_05710 [Erysipelotrichales bacterium]|nr:hypothetical protein [Erysipelotrichales bacterium]
MKKNIKKALIFVYLLFSCTTLSSCSVGMLGDYYFKIDGVVQQKIHFNVFNRATLTTYYYENGKVSSITTLNTNWQHTSQRQKDENGSHIVDETDNLIRKEAVNLTYYENDIKRVIQFYLVDDVLIDYHFNKEFQVYREFTR